MILEIAQYKSDIGGLAYILVKPNARLNYLTITSIIWKTGIPVGRGWVNTVREESLVPFRLQFIY